jgi:hypothetical protein
MISVNDGAGKVPPPNIRQGGHRMPSEKWRLKGQWIKSCGCAYGCPCDFNAPPTRGSCQGIVAMKIESGHFDDMDLSGLAFTAIGDWPGALHEGNGILQPIVDERANAKQREALLTIMSGKEQAEGTLFHIFSLIVTKVLDPLFLPIDFSFDMAKRRARVSIPGVLETESEPIKNPVTGAEHRIRVVIPEGFEHHQGEIASARYLRASGKIKYSFQNSHSTLAEVEHTPQGLVHPAA